MLRYQTGNNVCLLWCRNVLACRQALARGALREGVVQQYPKPTRLNGRKKMLIALSQGRAIFVEMEYGMDHLLQCAKSFGRLS